MRLLIAMGIALAGASCGVPDCGTLRQADQRDECRFSVLEVHLAEGDLAAATDLISAIEQPLVRVAAIRRLVAARPAGLGDEEVRALCRAVPPPDDVGCLKAVARPHLWER